MLRTASNALPAPEFHTIEAIRDFLQSPGICSISATETRRDIANESTMPTDIAGGACC
jgi:hypothetical protein